MKKNKSIGIVGGGFTGLTTAYKLLKAGFDVTILEGSNSLGGLAGSLNIEGQNLEIAYHHLFKTDKSIIELVKELGIEKHLVWYESSVCVVTSDRQIYSFSSPIDLLKFNKIPLISRLRGGITTLFLKIWKNWKIFERYTAINWMSKFSGKTFTHAIWKPLLKGKFSEYFDKISMAWLWARIHIRANSRDKGVSKEELGYFESGFNIVVQSLENYIKQLGGKIFLNEYISKIIIKDDNQITLQTTNNKEYLFDSVVFTTPSNVFCNVIKNSNINNQKIEDYVNKIEKIEYLNAVILIFSSTQDISKFYWHNILDENAPFLVFINHTKLVPKEWYNNKNIYYIGAYVTSQSKIFNLNEEEIKSIWFEYLQSIFPNFDRIQITESFVFKLKNAQHIVDVDYANKIPSYTTPIPNLYLCNFSQIYPEDRGTNYAVREGIKIAEFLININNTNK